MTDEELAEASATKFTDINFNEPDNYGSEKEVGHFSYYTGFLAGLNEGRPKWHDIRKNPNDLPEMLHPVFTKLDSGTYVFAFCVNKIWRGNDDGMILCHGNGKSEVIAWFEIPRYTEG